MLRYNINMSDTVLKLVKPLNSLDKNVEKIVISQTREIVLNRCKIKPINMTQVVFIFLLEHLHFSNLLISLILLAI